MLVCVSPYKSGLGRFAPGDTVSDPDLCGALLNDSPGSFEAVKTTATVAPEQVAEAIEAAPVDRMMRRSSRKGA